MKNDEQLFFKTDDFLKGKLPPEEAAAFEREIAADPELAEAVELQRFEREGLEYMMQQNLRAKMKAWKTSPLTDDNLPPDSAKSPGKRRVWLGLMGAALLFVAVFLISKNWSTSSPEHPETPAEQPPQSQPQETAPPPANQETPIANPSEKKQEGKQPEQQPENRYAILSKSAYELPEDLRPEGLRSEPENGGKSILSPAIKAFKSSPPDYKTAIRELRKINKQEHPKEFDRAQEMLAHACYNTGQFGEAARIFQAMTEQVQDETAHDRAEWYLLLSLLPDYGRQKARVDGLFKNMTQEAYHDYWKSAAKLKEALQ